MTLMMMMMAVVGRGAAVAAEKRAGRRAGRPERQMTTNLCPGDDARLDDHFRLRPEVLRLPQDEVGERPCGDLPDEMADAVRDSAVHVHSRRESNVARI